MPELKKSLSLAALAAGSLALSACASKAPPELPPQPGGTVDPNANNAGVGQVVPGSQADFTARMMGDDTIYFDTDRYNIDSVDAAALAKQAGFLGQYSNRRITIEGHADERGTRDTERDGDGGVRRPVVAA